MISILLFALLAQPQNGVCQPGASVSLKVDPVNQECPQWCWAATTQMMLAHFGKTDVQQCKEADSEFGFKTCCGAKPGADCCHGGWPELEKFGFQVTVRAGDTNVMSANLIKNQIACVGSPIAHSWKWPGADNGGHMILIYGYHTDRAGTLWLETIDPDGPIDPQTNRATIVIGAITYDTYVNGPKPGSRHWKDFYGVHKGDR